MCGGENERAEWHEEHPLCPSPESLALPGWSLPATAEPGDGPAPTPTPSSERAQLLQLSPPSLPRLFIAILEGGGYCGNQHWGQDKGIPAPTAPTGLIVCTVVAQPREPMTSSGDGRLGTLLTRPMGTCSTGLDALGTDHPGNGEIHILFLQPRLSAVASRLSLRAHRAP